MILEYDVGFSDIIELSFHIGHKHPNGSYINNHNSELQLIWNFRIR